MKIKSEKMLEYKIAGKNYKAKGIFFHFWKDHLPLHLTHTHTL